MFSDNPPEQQKAALSELTTLSDDLCALLLQEREALVSSNRDGLKAIVDAKRAKCAEIERCTAALGTVPLREQIAQAEPGVVSELERLHKILLTRADQAQEYNAVNGKIVHRTQQSVRDLIHLISGKDADLLYSQQGQTMATAKGTAIARA